MTAGGWKADSAAERVGRLGEEALEVRDEAKRVGVWGIEKGRRAWPARTPAASGGLLCSTVSSAREKEGERRSENGLGDRRGSGGT